MNILKLQAVPAFGSDEVHVSVDSDTIVALGPIHDIDNDDCDFAKERQLALSSGYKIHILVCDKNETLLKEWW